MLELPHQRKYLRLTYGVLFYILYWQKEVVQCETPETERHVVRSRSEPVGLVQSKEGRTGMESTCLYDTRHEKKIHINRKGINYSMCPMCQK